MFKKVLYVAVGVIALGTAGYLVWSAVQPSPIVTNTATNTEQLPSPATTPSPSTNQITTTPITNPQIGVNFIRYFFNDAKNNVLNTTTPYLQPPSIFSDYSAIGVQMERQLVKGDLMWLTVEPQAGVWNWTAADQVIGQSPANQTVTLFNLQYASPTPPWAKPGEFQKTFGADAEAYLKAVIDRYGSKVKYWELGNEMDHWRAVDPGVKIPPALANQVQLPAVKPDDGFSPQDQGKFLAAAAAYIRAHDADAVIVMPGVSGLEDYQIKTWLAGVIQTAGKDTFDIVNYHDYAPWDKMITSRANFTKELATLGLAGKPVWLTETGATSEASLTTRTNYPNSQSSQAADIFRRIIPSYAAGDALALWHTYISSAVMTGNTWGEYGILSDKNVKKLSYYAFKLLTSELIPFSTVTTVSSSSNQHIYKIATVAGTTRYVAWGSGSYALPLAGRYTSVVPSSDGTFAWQTNAASAMVTLSDTPVLLEITP